MKYEIDSEAYLETAKMLTSHGVFAQQKGDNIVFENFRTPGYPLFLSLTHGFFKIPLPGILLIQILLTVLAAFFTYQAAVLIDATPRFAQISALIVLWDPGTTIYSLMILSEPLFLFLMTIFMYVFIHFLKSRNLGWLFLSAVLLVICAYVRPVNYYLAIPVAIFAGYTAKNQLPIKMILIQVLAFLIFIYILIGLWHLRNYHHFKKPIFSSITQVTVYGTGLLWSYQKCRDLVANGLPPWGYLCYVTVRRWIGLFTRPGSFKYFQSERLKIIGASFGYPFMILWMMGFLWGITHMQGRPEFLFLFLILLYYTSVLIVGTLFGVNPRFRIPMMPSIAILSSYGWVLMGSQWRNWIKSGKFGQG